MGYEGICDENRGQTGRFQLRAIVVFFARGSIRTRVPGGRAPDSLRTNPKVLDMVPHFFDNRFVL